MIEREIDLTKYLYQKIIQALMFEEYIEELLQEGCFDFYLFNEEFLDCLDEFIDICIEAQCIEEAERKNLFSVLFYWKENAIFDDKQSKKKFYDKINHIIIKLNCIDMNKVDSTSWYISEMRKRVYKYSLFKNMYSHFEQKKEVIRRSIARDYLVLIYNRYEDTGSAEFLEEFGNDFYYFMSVNALLSEVSVLRDIETFRNFVKAMCKYYREHSQSIERDASMIRKHVFIYKHL